MTGIGFVTLGEAMGGSPAHPSSDSLFEADTKTRTDSSEKGGRMMSTWGKVIFFVLSVAFTIAFGSKFPRRHRRRTTTFS